MSPFSPVANGSSHILTRSEAEPPSALWWNVRRTYWTAPPPLHQGFHGESSWFPISLSHLLGYQRGAHCLALNYWSGICIIFFLLSDFQRNTVAGKLLCHHQPLVLNHAKMNLATGNECRFAIVLLIRLQSSATEMHVREYKTFIVRPNWYDK